MSARPPNAAMRLYMGAIVLAAWFGLLLQLYLLIAQSLASGRSFVGTVINYLSFFTILTNILAALTLTLSLWMPNSAGGRFFGRNVVRTGVALYIAMVGIGYSLLLRHLWSPEGFQKIADVVLHDLVPVTYVVYWLLAPKVRLPWQSVLWWLIYPVAYLSYILVRGRVSGQYQYPFIDVASFGYSHVLVSTAMLLLGFLILGMALVGVSRLFGRTTVVGA